MVIAGLIVTVVVGEAIKGLAFRAFAHVFKESLKAIPPTLTNGYTSTAILWIILVSTPSLH